MSLHKLDIYRVRNIQQATLYPSTGINFIYGNNGSGKSALLEAIFILGRSRSFRTHNIKHVINYNASDLVVSGQCLRNNGHITQIGVQLSYNDSEIRINQASHCKRSELAYTFPVQFVYPKSYQLLDGGSSMRREFMDWGIFNQDEDYLLVWQKYKKCLLHRNALLKDKNLAQLPIWDNELVHYAKLVSNYRMLYIEQLQENFINTCRLFFDIDSVALSYFPGWDFKQEFHDILVANLSKDCRYGITHYGAHRSDFYLLINNRIAKDYASRGQLKILVLALKLAQIQLLSEKFSKMGCFFIDDFGAELDSVNKFKLLQFLADSKIQVFLSANEISQFGDFTCINEAKWFQVEQGCIKQV